MWTSQILIEINQVVSKTNHVDKYELPNRIRFTQKNGQNVAEKPRLRKRDEIG